MVTCVGEEQPNRFYGSITLPTQGSEIYTFWPRATIFGVPASLMQQKSLGVYHTQGAPTHSGDLSYILGIPYVRR